MNVQYKESFARDLRGLKDKNLLRRIRELLEVFERSSTLSDIAGVKKLKGAGSYYCIRLGDYRLWLVTEGDAVTFVRFLHRKEIYRYFP